MSLDAARESRLREESPFEAVVGLEVHVQLGTRTKMFCGCENRFGAEPNSLTCPVCLGLPGALPVINREAVRLALRAALACRSTVSPTTKFDRKNYFYPDLPKGYQISQFDQPLGNGGAVEYLLDGERRTVRLKRIHLEEDAGKSLHLEARPVSWVDLNRAGVPLLEIVTEPELHSVEEVGACLRMLRLVMVYLGVSSCNMEEGSLRCDANVSIRPRGSPHLETRTEIKNLNSFTNVEHAVRVEVERQISERSRGAAITQETRLFDPERCETRPMRGKEEAHDYRYFPEPDLSPLSFPAQLLDELRGGLGELPVQRLERLERQHGLSRYHAEVLVRDPDVARFFEECAVLYPQAKSVANWVVNALREELNARRVALSALPIMPQRFVDLVRAVDEGAVSSQKAREVFRAMLDSGRPVRETIEALGLGQISDDVYLREVVARIVSANPGPVADARGGKSSSLNFLVGQVMRESKGKANPARVMELLREGLGL